MIKNIIFDFGGVIITLSHIEGVRRFKALGVEDADKQLDPYTQGGIFGQLEKGEIDAEQFRLLLSQMVHREVSADECFHAWLGYREDVPQRNLDILRQLRKEGYRLILLSNTNPYMMRWAANPGFDGHGHAVQDYFDATYLSYQLGVMKPDIRFFDHVIAHENIIPQETLFVDDGPRNVAAAAKLGLKTFCPENGSDWTQAIRDHLG